MGQNISKSLIPPPLSLRDCFIDGRIDIARYIYYRRRMEEIEEDEIRHMDRFLKKKRKFDDFLSSGSDLSSNVNSSSNYSTSQTATSFSSSKLSYRSVKKHRVYVRDDDGSLRELLPTDTIWYLLYVKEPPQHERLLKTFRNRFRLPYSSFVELSDEIYENEMFSRWRCSDCTGDKPSNIKLLLLGSLRYLGRSWTFDDVHEANGISREVNRNFFETFIEFGSSCLYKKHVIDVAKNITFSENEKLFKEAGFNGCIGSADATHVSMLKCASWASVNHKGFKLNHPARTYNLTVNHCRQILGSTQGHPSTWNDKTLIHFDPLISSVHDGNIPDNFEFSLFEKDETGRIIEVTYYGVWFMVDNGYLSWSCTIPPIKDPKTYQCLRFSEWLESMRKDVECTFGIMKGRFSILRYGIRLHSVKNVDKVWLTCCALHNRLLFVDGLNKGWENGVQSDYYSGNETNFAINRLHRNFSSHEVTHSDVDLTSIDWESYTENGRRVVNKIPFHIFRQCLVNHFDIRFKQNSLKWPKRNKTKQTIL